MSPEERQLLHRVSQEVHEIGIKSAIGEQQLKQINTTLETLVTRWEFTPIKLIVYGGTGLILSAVVAALISLVVMR